MNTLRMSIEDLKLPDAITSRLRVVGVRTVGGLSMLTPTDLLHLGLSVGEVTTTQVALDAHGERLAEDELDNWLAVGGPPTEPPARSNEDRFADALERLADSADRIVGILEKNEARQAEMMALLTNPAALMAKVRSAMESVEASPISESSRPDPENSGVFYPRPWDC